MSGINRQNFFELKQSPPMSKRAPTAIDLFSGAGGITLGLRNAGFDVRLCSDINPACASTHSRNFPEIPFMLRDLIGLTSEDIRRVAGISPGELDLLIGGPPCQGFSIIGQRERGDPRNRLFFEFLRVAKDLQPKVLVIENVPGLATLAGGAVLREIAAGFNAAGYDMEGAELLAAQYGVPQMRWRMVFIGWRRNLERRGGFPAPTHGEAAIGDLVPNRTIPPKLMKGFVTIRDAISDLPVIDAGGLATDYAAGPRGDYQHAMRAGATAVTNHYAPKLSRQNLERIRSLKPGQDWRDLPVALLPQGMQRAHRKDHTRRYRRMEWSGVARSIITRFRDPKSGEYTHPEQHRTISIREAARIQSFPDWFVFEGSYTDQYDQVGNAVPALMARALGREIAGMLAGEVTAYRVVNTRYSISAGSGPLFDLLAAEQA